MCAFFSSAALTCLWWPPCWQKLTDDRPSGRGSPAVAVSVEKKGGGEKKKTVLTLLRLDLPQGWIQPLVDMMDYCNGHLNGLFVMFKWQYIFTGKGGGGRRGWGERGGNLTMWSRAGKWCVWGVNKKASHGSVRPDGLQVGAARRGVAPPWAPTLGYCYWLALIMCINQRPLKAIIISGWKISGLGLLGGCWHFWSQPGL